MLNHRHSMPAFAAKTRSACLETSPFGVLETPSLALAMVQSRRTFASNGPSTPKPAPRCTDEAPARCINVENGYPNNSRKSEPLQMAVAFDLHVTSTSPLQLVMGDVISALQRPRDVVRTISECLSEDSYVMFEEAAGDDEPCSDLGSSADDDDDDDGVLQQADEDVEFSDEQHYEFGLDAEDGAARQEAKYRKKKVHFSTDAPRIHRIVAWSFAYRASRKGHWEECVRDRHRFQRRIASCEQSLGHVFDGAHRERVFRERFQGASPPAGAPGEADRGSGRRKRRRRRHGRRRKGKGHRRKS